MAASESCATNKIVGSANGWPSILLSRGSQRPVLPRWQRQHRSKDLQPTSWLRQTQWPGWSRHTQRMRLVPLPSPPRAAAAQQPSGPQQSRTNGSGDEGGEGGWPPLPKKLLPESPEEKKGALAVYLLWMVHISLQLFRPELQDTLGVPSPVVDAAVSGSAATLALTWDQLVTGPRRQRQANAEAEIKTRLELQEQMYEQRARWEAEALQAAVQAAYQAGGAYSPGDARGMVPIIPPPPKAPAGPIWGEAGSSRRGWQQQAAAASAASAAGKGRVPDVPRATAATASAAESAGAPQQAFGVQLPPPPSLPPPQASQQAGGQEQQQIGEQQTELQLPQQQMGRQQQQSGGLLELPSSEGIGELLRLVAAQPPGTRVALSYDLQQSLQQQQQQEGRAAAPGGGGGAGGGGLTVNLQLRLLAPEPAQAPEAAQQLQQVRANGATE